MINRQWERRWEQSYRLIMLICLFTVQSCSGSNKIATECFQLQETINTHQTSFSAGSINKASETAKAESEEDFANALTAVELSNSELQERRDRIVFFSREAHTLSLQAANVMTEDGTLSREAATQYEAILVQRQTVNDQLFAEQNGLQIHCSLQ